MTEDSLFYYLAKTCKALREAHDPPIKLSQIAAEADRDQSAIYRFEQGTNFPRDIETVVAAYATCCGIPSPLLIWADALALWGANDGFDREMLRTGALNRRRMDPAMEERFEALEKEIKHLAQLLEEDGSD